MAGLVANGSSQRKPSLSAKTIHSKLRGRLATPDSYSVTRGQRSFSIPLRMKTFTSVEDVLEDVERVINSIVAVDVDLASDKSSSVLLTPSRKKTESGDDNDDEAVEENAVVTPGEVKEKKRRPERRKPADMPRRPLSAYNLFFRVERERLLNGNAGDMVSPRDIDRLVVSTQDGEKKKRLHRKTHGRIAFSELARVISKRWKNLSQEAKDLFERHADKERLVYKKALEAWQKSKGISRTVSSEASSTEPPAPPKEPSSGIEIESLNTMMRRGRSFVHFQAMLDQKQAELRLRQSMLDHMHMMLSYTAEGYPGVDGPVHSPQPESLGQGYNEMADATFQMAQMMLPLPNVHQSQMSYQPTPTWAVECSNNTQISAPLVHGAQHASPTVHWAPAMSSHMPLEAEAPRLLAQMAAPSPEFAYVRPQFLSTSTYGACTSNPTVVALRPQQDDGPVPFDFEEGLDFNDGRHLESFGFPDTFGS